MPTRTLWRTMYPRKSNHSKISCSRWVTSELLYAQHACLRINLHFRPTTFYREPFPWGPPPISLLGPPNPRSKPLRTTVYQGVPVCGKTLGEVEPSVGAQQLQIDALVSACQGSSVSLRGKHIAQTPRLEVTQSADGGKSPGQAWERCHRRRRALQASRPRWP